MIAVLEDILVWTENLREQEGRTTESTVRPVLKRESDDVICESPRKVKNKEYAEN